MNNRKRYIGFILSISLVVLFGISAKTVRADELNYRIEGPDVLTVKTGQEIPVIYHVNWNGATENDLSGMGSDIIEVKSESDEVGLDSRMDSSNIVIPGAFWVEGIVNGTGYFTLVSDHTINRKIYNTTTDGHTYWTIDYSNPIRMHAEKTVKVNVKKNKSLSLDGAIIGYNSREDIFTTTISNFSAFPIRILSANAIVKHKYSKRLDRKLSLVGSSVKIGSCRMKKVKFKANGTVWFSPYDGWIECKCLYRNKKYTLKFFYCKEYPFGQLKVKKGGKWIWTCGWGRRAYKSTQEES